MDVPARRLPCVLGAHHVAVSKGVGARRSTGVQTSGIAPVSKECGKFQPLLALCFPLSRYRRNRLPLLAEAGTAQPPSPGDGTWTLTSFATSLLPARSGRGKVVLRTRPRFRPAKDIRDETMRAHRGKRASWGLLPEHGLWQGQRGGLRALAEICAGGSTQLCGGWGKSTRQGRKAGRERGCSNTAKVATVHRCRGNSPEEWRWRRGS